MKMVRKRVCKGICICILLIQPHEQSTKAVCVYGREYYVNDLRYKFLYFTSQKDVFQTFLHFHVHEIILFALKFFISLTKIENFQQQTYEKFK